MPLALGPNHTTYTHTPHKDTQERWVGAMSVKLVLTTTQAEPMWDTPRCAYASNGGVMLLADLETAFAPIFGTRAPMRPRPHLMPRFIYLFYDEQMKP